MRSSELTGAHVRDSGAATESYEREAITSGVDLKSPSTQSPLYAIPKQEKEFLGRFIWPSLGEYS